MFRPCFPEWSHYALLVNNSRRWLPQGGEDGPRMNNDSELPVSYLGPRNDIPGIVKLLMVFVFLHLLGASASFGRPLDEKAEPS